MNELVSIAAPALPELVAAAGERASMRFLEFFAAKIRGGWRRYAPSYSPAGGHSGPNAAPGRDTEGGCHRGG
jgi:hypothetical protein